MHGFIPPVPIRCHIAVFNEAQDDFNILCSYWIEKRLPLSFSYCRIEEKELSTRKNTNAQPAAVLVTALAA